MGGWAAREKERERKIAELRKKVEFRERSIARQRKIVSGMKSEITGLLAEQERDKRETFGVQTQLRLPYVRQPDRRFF